MAAKKKSPTSTGWHTPVSNDPEETVISKTVSKPPMEGVNPKKGKVNDDGTEAVKEYKRIKAPEKWVAKFLALPKGVHLRDIGEASFGLPSPKAKGVIATPETVIGADDRIQITNTSAYPWRVHCSLMITGADNSMWIGTGWFIGPRTLMTAGHCVYIKNSGVPGRDGWVKKIVVMPGRSGSTLPYGSVTSTSFRSVTGWTEKGDPNYDYGAIILPTDLGNTVGWIGFGVYKDSELLAATGNLSGYPGDKPSGTQWYHARRINSVNSLKVFYDIDTMGGQSGSAVYQIINGDRYAVAIHAYGIGGDATVNSGTRITNAVFNNMQAWLV
jgi:glutamyl endopeptidase